MIENENYDNLVQEFVEQRNALKAMIQDLENIKSKIDSILPENMDKRYIRYFEEKIKTITELFKAILDMRKEISKITKDEFELRRKISASDDDDLDGIVDIRKIAAKVDGLRKQKILLEQKIEKDDKSEDSENSNEMGSVIENVG